MHNIRVSSLVVHSGFLLASLFFTPCWAGHLQATVEKLFAGEVLIDHRKDGVMHYVVGKILISEAPQRVWSILVNPFEFESISDKMIVEHIDLDKPDTSIMTCRIDPGFFMPPIRYVVQSDYEQPKKITFKCLGGDFDDFRGQWLVEPGPSDGTSVVTYAMYANPKFPIPQLIVRQAIKFELPRTLNAFRARVNAIWSGKRAKEKRNIAAGTNTV